MNKEEPATSQKKKKDKRPEVLIVDDNLEYAKLFDLLSESIGFNAHVVSCCNDAMKVLESTEIDIVLMDWVMPEIDGPQCTEKIRKLEQIKKRRIPVIGVSGYVKATPQTCKDAGMDDFLAIPFSLDHLQEKLEFWVSQKK